MRVYKHTTILFVLIFLSVIGGSTFANSHSGASTPHVHIHTGHQWLNSNFNYYEHFNGANQNCQRRVISSGSVTEGWIGTGCDSEYDTISVGPSGDCRDQGYKECDVQIRGEQEVCNHGSCDTASNSDSQKFSIDWSVPSVSWDTGTPSSGTVQNSDFTAGGVDSDAYSGLNNCYYEIDDLGMSGTQASGTRSCDGGFTVDVGNDCQTRDSQACEIRIWADDNAGNTDPKISRSYWINYQPQIDSYSFSDSGSDHEFSVSVDVSDQDGEGDISTCEARVDDGDGNANTYSLTIDTGYGDSTQAQCTGTIRYDDMSGWGHTESMNVQFYVDDGARSQSTSNSHAFPNHQPTIVSSDSYSDSTSSHAFSVTAVGEDTDAGSNEINGCQVIHSDNDGNNYTTSGTLDQSYGATAEAECSLQIAAERNGGFTGYEPLETITTQVRFLDRHGSTGQTGSTSHTLPNHAPSIIDDISLSNSSTEHAFTATAAARDDDDTGELADCTVTYTGPDGTTTTRNGTLDQSFGAGDEAQCSYQLKARDSPFNVKDSIDASITFEDDYGATAQSSTATTRFPNRAPVIEQEQVWPEFPEFGDQPVLGINVSDIEDQTVWANLTVTESGDTIVDNANGTKTINGTYQLWNMTEFDLDREEGRYDWEITVSDGYTTTSTSGQFILEEVAPNVTRPTLTRPDPWGFEDDQYRPGDTIIVDYQPTDANGRPDIDAYHANISSPDGTELGLRLPDEEDTIINGYDTTFRYTIPEDGTPGTWNITTYVRDSKGLTDINHTTFTLREVETVTKGIEYDQDNDSEQYIDKQNATPGVFENLDYPHFISVEDTILSGLIDYGAFEQLHYGMDDGRIRVNMTHRGIDDLTLLPYTPGGLREISEVRNLITDRQFLDQTVATVAYGTSNVKHVRIETTFRDDNIKIRGFNQSLGQGTYTLTLTNRGVEVDEVVVEVDTQ